MRVPRCTIALGILALAACADSDPTSSERPDTPAFGLVSGPSDQFCGIATTVDLVADETVVVGSVEVMNDGDAVYVTFRTDADGPLINTAVAVSYDPADIPTTRSGNPQPGRFPYKAEHAELTSVTWKLDAPVAVGEVLHVVAFAEVLLNGEEEGSWGAGEPVNPAAGWATRFTHTVQSCDGGVTVTVPTTGGTIRTPGLELEIFPGSIDQETTFTIATTAFPDPDPDLPIVFGTAWEILPSGTTFDPPAELTLAYRPEQLPPGFDEADLVCFVESGGVLEWIEPTDLDQINNLIVCPLSHLSTVGWSAGWISVTITAPAGGSLFPVGAPITFIGEALASNGSDLSGNLEWAVVDLGPLGEGVSVTTTAPLVSLNPRYRARFRLSLDVDVGVDDMILIRVGEVKVAPLGACLETGESLEFEAVLSNAPAGTEVAWAASVGEISGIRQDGAKRFATYTATEAGLGTADLLTVRVPSSAGGFLGATASIQIGGCTCRIYGGLTTVVEGEGPGLPVAELQGVESVWFTLDPDSREIAGIGWVGAPGATTGDIRFGDSWLDPAPIFEGDLDTFGGHGQGILGPVIFINPEDLTASDPTLPPLEIDIVRNEDGNVLAGAIRGIVADAAAMAGGNELIPYVLQVAFHIEADELASLGDRRACTDPAIGPFEPPPPEPLEPPEP